MIAFLYSFVGLLLYLAYRLMRLPPTVSQSLYHVQDESLMPEKVLLVLRALQATFAVVLITLVLFFASGMYDEKIRYAHRYFSPFAVAKHTS
jgi:hypothetical protein